ncbi:MAG: AMP-binding enzyme [Janthinobacterium lividum]
MSDLLSAEARALGAATPAAPWSARARLDESGLGVDSLDRIALAAALSEAIHLHRGGNENLLGHDTVGAWCRTARRSLDTFSAAVTFRSSGSSGQPRGSVHALEALLEEVDAIAALLPGRRRVLTAVPSHHIFGFLFTQLLPARLGVPIRDLRAHSPGALARVARPGDLVVGHPLFWAAAARAAPRDWPADVVGVTSGSPMSAATAAAAKAAGLSRLVDVYGATETAGIGWRDAPDAVFHLLPHWRRVDDALCRGAAAPVAPPDLLQWEGNDRFHVLGRRDTVVQVGGVNVSAAHVRSVLLTHPGVADAAVRMMRHGEGDRLKAFVVPSAPGGGEWTLRDELVRLVAARLAPAERPRNFSFGAVLPTGPSGKAADWSISKPALMQEAGWVEAAP